MQKFIVKKDGEDNRKRRRGGEGRDLRSEEREIAETGG
jgi:hypothetical protein